MNNLLTVMSFIIFAVLTTISTPSFADTYGELVDKAHLTLGNVNGLIVNRTLTMKMSGMQIPLRMEIEALRPGLLKQKLISSIINVEVVVNDSSTTTIYPLLKKYSIERNIAVPADGQTETLFNLHQSIISYNTLILSLIPPEKTSRITFSRVDTLRNEQGDHICAVFNAEVDSTIVTNEGFVHIIEVEHWIGVNDGIAYRSQIDVSREVNCVEILMELETLVESLNLEAILSPTEFTFVPPANYSREDILSKALVENSLVGKMAPDVMLTSMDSTTVNLSDIQNDILIVDFWATWCAPCRKELEEIRKALKDKILNVQVIFISNEGRDIVASYINEHGLPMKFYLDMNKSATAAFAVTHLPTLFIIDRNRIIREHYVGYTPVSILVDTIRMLQ